jgi:alkanesulfonate monooxygenase SsuD/methylene tetrahydromethanopterin reductase-like flavin-dependent oxidoreductase (luciferase family)
LAPNRRLCDGWIPQNIPFPDIVNNFEYIINQMEEIGRNTTIDVAPYVSTAVSDNTEEMKDAIQDHIAYWQWLGLQTGGRPAVPR